MVAIGFGTEERRKRAELQRNNERERERERERELIRNSLIKSRRERELNNNIYHLCLELCYSLILKVELHCNTIPKFFAILGI